MADKTKIWGAIPWWIFSWGGCADASLHLHSWNFIPLRLTRNLLLILITPREWIGRNIRQIGLSHIFYLHIPVTESQAHFLSLYFFICSRGNWGCSVALDLHSRLQAWVLPSELRKALKERRGKIHRRVRWLYSSCLRVKRCPSPPCPACYLLSLSSSATCHMPDPVLDPAGMTAPSNLHGKCTWARHGAMCLMGTSFCFLFSLFLTL